MNIKLNAFKETPGHGIFSRFMLMLPNSFPFDDVENIYFNQLDVKVNQFDWIFNQYYNESFVDVDCVNNGVYSQEGNSLGFIEDSNDFIKLRQLCSKIKIKKEITDVIERYTKDMKEGCLGVHVRVGDMNVHHPQFGIYTTQDFINRIKEINPPQIFVASDNHASIRRIKESVNCEILCVDNMLREDNDDFKYQHIFDDNFYAYDYWGGVWIDTLMLSRCSEMLCRVSNVPNAAQLFSHTLKKIHRL